MVWHEILGYKDPAPNRKRRASDNVAPGENPLVPVPIAVPVIVPSPVSSEPPVTLPVPAETPPTA
jgi:hypothetical protein